ncbi:MAG: hypothetical protein OEL75_03755, partial [Kiritimatiellaceae bacterium]|nr:hypothetical protein [Kiritimatiellaceae bacterium]
IPAGVVVTSISHDGSWDAVHRKVKWAFFDGAERSLTYSVEGQPGVHAALGGEVSFDGSEDPVTGNSIVAVPLPFRTWLEQRSIPGDANMFGVMNTEYGLPHGLVYAFGFNLNPEDKAMTLRSVGGKMFVDIPAQNHATLSFVDVWVEGATDLGGEWTLTPSPVIDQSGVPVERQRWKLDDAPEKAFYRIKAELK